MVLVKDTRNGYGESVQFQIQYENFKNIGTIDGVPSQIYIEQVPWILEKRTYQFIGPDTFWEGKISEMEQSYQDFAINQVGMLLESVSPREKLIIDGDVHYAGSYTEAYYLGIKGTLPSQFNLFEYSTGSVSPSGYWSGVSGPIGAAIFSSEFFSETATRTYTATAPTEVVGQNASIAGISGIITNVSTSNPRYIGGSLYYNISVQLTSQIGSKIDV